MHIPQLNNRDTMNSNLMDKLKSFQSLFIFMSKKNSLLNFVNIVNILVEPWTTNRIKEYESLFAQLKTNREKVAVMILTIFFQVPKVSIKSSKILSEKCHIPISDIPNALPQIVFNCLLRLIPVLSVKKDMTYTKVALMCASSLPTSQLRFLFEVFLKYPEFHLAHSVYSIMFDRDPTLSNFLSDNFEKCENLLPYAFSSFSLQPFSNEFILKVVSLFLSGKIQTTSSFFYSFCFYINRRLFPIDFETTDYFVLTLFQKIETFFAPHGHSYLFDLISKTLDDNPLPFISIHLFFQDFDENQIKSVFTSLIKGNGSIKSFFVLSQVVSSEKMKELYSIATCTRFCTYSVMKKNIYFFKRSLEKITSLHFELRMLSKILEIASIPEFENVSFEFLEIFKQFTTTASAMSDILKIFFTRDKKLISGMISRNTETKANVLTALYLLGNSPIVANPRLKTRFKSLTKALIPRINISDLKINCLMPKSLSSTLSRKNLTNEELSLFYYNLTVRQIKPAPFNIDNAVNIIGLFQINRDDLGYKVRENLPVPPDAFININQNQNKENIIPKSEIDQNFIENDATSQNSNGTEQNPIKNDNQISDQNSIEKSNSTETKSNLKRENTINSSTNKVYNLVFQSSIVDSLEPTKNIETKNLNRVNLVPYSTVVYNINPTLIENQESATNLVIQSFADNTEPLLSDNQKTLKLVLQTSVISSMQPTSDVEKEQKIPSKLSFQSTIISNVKPTQESVKNDKTEEIKLVFQSAVISNVKPTLELKPNNSNNLVIQPSLDENFDLIQANLVKTDISVIFSILPTKTSAEIQLENLKKNTISKYNTSTQTKPKKNDFIMSENTTIIEKVPPPTKSKFDICYDLNNTFEFSMLSDDNLSSQEFIEQEEPVIKSDNTTKSKNKDSQLKISENKTQKQLKISDNKNQKQLKISDNKNQKQSKISDNKNQKKNAPTSKELSKSRSYSLSKGNQTFEEKTTKQKSSQPNLPKPPSDAKKNNANQKQSNDMKSKTDNNDLIHQVPRPKSLNNIIDDDDENLHISSDDIGFALPSDDYEFSDSKSSYSLSGLSEFDDEELNKMFGDDKEVQMFADMLLPPDK